jgi:hypothetical protein
MPTEAQERIIRFGRSRARNRAEASSNEHCQSDASTLFQCANYKPNFQAQPALQRSAAQFLQVAVFNLPTACQTAQFGIGTAIA